MPKRTLCSQDLHVRRALATEIIQRIHQLELTPTETACRLNLDLGTLWRIRNLYVDRVSLSKLVELADLLGLNVSLATSVR
ncbi:XRE family transcriptional regulator [Nocardia jejuensis]|uniref:XRE family transcriptional regulator n=1 Tax=Nocardia jejuensis TaxID=328049 RepID=UPI0012F92482|nr:XRE family transcriptional regulator [Nocardia jejuensis]